MIWDCVIVGGGPAGLTAATYLGRFQREVLLVDAGESRLKRIPLSRNTPGFPNGIKGADFLALLQDQARQYGALFRAGSIESVQVDDDGFRLSVDLDELRARTVLLATGVKLAEPMIERLDDGLNRGIIRYCPICDGYEAQGQRIAVLGGRKGAIAEAHFLRTYSHDVTYLHMDGGSPTIREIEKAEAAGIGLECVPVCDIKLGEKVQLTLADGNGVVFDVLYPCLGCAPQSDLARQAGALCSDELGVLVDRHQQTNVPGLYAAGDVLQGLDQIASACGQGAIAAVAIHNALREEEAKRSQN